MMKKMESYHNVNLNYNAHSPNLNFKKDDLLKKADTVTKSSLLILVRVFCR